MLDWDVIAPMLVMIVLTLTVGGVLILRPIAKRVGDLLDVMIREKQVPGPGASGEVTRIREILESLDARLSLMEERQDFTDSLLDAGSRAALPATRQPPGRV